MLAKDLDSLTLADMRVLANGHLTGYSSLKVGPMRDKLRAYMEQNPGKITLGTAVDTVASTGTAGHEGEGEGDVGEGDIEEATLPRSRPGHSPIKRANVKPVTLPPLTAADVVAADLTDCSVLECDDIRPYHEFAKCELCELYFCPVHKTHEGHAPMGLKVGRVAAPAGADWDKNKTLPSSQVAEPSAATSDAMAKRTAKRKKSAAAAPASAPLTAPIASSAEPEAPGGRAPTVPTGIDLQAASASAIAGPKRKKAATEAAPVPIPAVETSSSGPTLPVPTIPLQVPPAASTFRGEGDDPAFREEISSSKVRSLAKTLLERRSTYRPDELFNQLNFTSYDIEFLSGLAQLLNVDISQVLAIKRVKRQQVAQALVDKFL